MRNTLLLTTALFALVHSANANAADKTQIVVGDGEEKFITEGIYSGYKTDKDGAVINNSGKVVVEEDTVFSDNSALNDTHETPSEQGGAIYSAGDNATVIIGEEVSFVGNKAYSGGAIYLAQGSDMIIGDEVKFINNSGICNGEGCSETTPPSAGAIAIAIGKDQGTEEQVSNVKIGNNALFSGNRGAWAGAIKISPKSGALENVKVVIGENAVFENNVAEGNTNYLQAGAIYNQGILEIGKNATFKGNKVIRSDEGVGTGGAIVNQSGAKLTLNGSLFENNLAASAGGAIRNKGELILNGDNVFTSNKMADGSFNDISNTGNITVNGRLALDGGISDNGYITFEKGSNLTVNAGKTTISNNVINKGADLDIILNNGYEGGKYTLVTGSLDNEFIVNENALFDIVADTANKGTYEISKKSTEEFAASTGANANQAATVAAITSASSDSAAFNNVANAISELLQSSDKAKIAAGLNATTAMAPETSPMVQGVQSETSAQIFNAVSTRMTGGAIAPATKGAEGMSSGDGIYEKIVTWVQGLFNKSDLENTSKAKGFSSETYGLAMGAEKQIDTQTKAGAGYAYSNSEVDGFLRSTDVDTHTLFVYGEYKPSNWYVNAIASYGWSDYSEDKYVAGYKVGADYDVESFGLQAMTGYEMEFKGYGVTPEVGFRYIHIAQDGYRDSADQKVSANDSDIFTGVLGVKASKEYKLENNMILRPEVRMAVTYDMFTDDGASVVTLPNGASYRVEGDALNRFGMEFGAGVTADVNEKVEVSFGYEGKFRNNYEDHTGLLSAKYKF